MPRSVPASALRVTALLAMAGLVVPGCHDNKKSGDAAAAGATKVKIELNDDACKASPASIPAGAATFEATNTSANKVTEAELLQGETIVGKKENLTPGLSGTFSLRLEAGSYTLYCPNASTEKIDFKVTGS